MSLLNEMLALYRANGHDGFLRRHEHPMLLHIQSTETQPLPLGTVVNFPDLLAQAAATDVQVFPVVKRPGSTGNGVTLGRTEEADIPLLYQDISKEHAVISQVKGVFSVADLGSRNGTAVNGKILAKNVPEIIDDGADLAFARIHCCFMLPEGFAMLLKWVRIPQ